MNQKFSFRTVQHALWTGALVLGAVAASADTQVTFQVDMTVAIQNAIFNPSNQTVAASGTFDGWANSSILTNNPNAANSNLYSGTFDDTGDTNGAIMQYQYRIIQNGNVIDYSSQVDANNYCAILPVTSGANLMLPVQFWSDDGAAVTNNITFQVDMAEQIQLGNFDPSSEMVYALGSFDGWGDVFQLTNDPTILHTNSQGVVSTNVYVGTYPVAASPGAFEEFKYVTYNGNNNYEGPSAADGDPQNGNNRFFFNQAQSLPIVYFSDVPLAVTVTNTVTFEIDMTTQIEAGNFTVGSNTVEIHGDYNNWGSGTTLTNDPNSGMPNIYSLPITYIGAAGMQRYFKYVIQPGTQWENVSAANAVNGNRYLSLLTQNGGFTNGPVYFSDEPPSALIDFVTVSNCMVTFTVQMTNAVGTDGTIFDNTYPSSDTIYLNGLNNGDNNSFWTWAQPPFPGGPSAYAMTQISNSTLFTITLPVAMGQNDLLIYKYSINGFDNEGGFGDNHSRWIRSLPDYTMPTDTFGSQGGGTQTEIPAGNLGIASAAANQVQVSWLGRRGVELQTASSLTGPWTSQPATDGTNLIVAPGGMASTNFNIGSGALFYRLVGPQ